MKKKITCYAVYDRGIRFLEPENGPVVTYSIGDAEKVLKYLSGHFADKCDKKGHRYRFEIIPVPADKSVEDFMKELIGWAFQFSEWREYGRDYWHSFSSREPTIDRLNPDGSILSLYHIEKP